MLRFFRINDPYRLVFIFFILIGARCVQGHFIDGQSLLELKWILLGEWLGKGFLMYRETYDYTGPLAAMVYKCIDHIVGRSPFVHHALSSIVIIIQARIFNDMLLKSRAFDENSYLPAFFYVIIIVSIPDFMALSPQLMSMTFVLMTLSNVLRRIDNQATDELFLNSGLYVGVATMIYLPAFVFLFVFLVSLLIFSSAVIRRLLLYLFGFVLVMSMCAVYFYWHGDLYYFIEFFFVKGLLLDANQMLSFQEILFISSSLILVLLLAIFSTFSSERLTNFQQRVRQVIWLMSLGAIACFFLTNNKAGIELIFTAPLVAYFLNHYFVLLRNRIFEFIMPGVVIFGLLGFNLYVYQNSSLSLVAKEKPSNGEKILVLGEDLGYYLNSESGSPCFDQSICVDAFSGLDFYESSSHIYQWIEKTNPDLIIDKIGVTPRLFHRFPLLGVKYKKDPLGRFKKVSN